MSTIDNGTTFETDDPESRPPSRSRSALAIARQRLEIEEAAAEIREMLLARASGEVVDLVHLENLVRNMQGNMADLLNDLEGRQTLIPTPQVARLQHLLRFSDSILRSSNRIGTNANANLNLAANGGARTTNTSSSLSMSSTFPNPNENRNLMADRVYTEVDSSPFDSNFGRHTEINDRPTLSMPSLELVSSPRPTFRRSRVPPAAGGSSSVPARENDGNDSVRVSRSERDGEFYQNQGHHNHNTHFNYIYNQGTILNSNDESITLIRRRPLQFQFQFQREEEYNNHYSEIESLGSSSPDQDPDPDPEEISRIIRSCPWYFGDSSTSNSHVDNFTTRSRGRGRGRGRVSMSIANSGSANSRLPPLPPRARLTTSQAINIGSNLHSSSIGQNRNQNHNNTSIETSNVKKQKEEKEVDLFSNTVFSTKPPKVAMIGCSIS